MNNKVGVGSESVNVYRGWVVDFDKCLKTGWYTYGDTAIGGRPYDYGVLVVQTSTEIAHNDKETWIWQERRSTRGIYERRQKVGGNPWSSWKEF